MNVREIVADWLQEHGYDGLCTPDTDGHQCWCAVDMPLRGLIPCSGSYEIPTSCVAGRKIPCTNDKSIQCDGDCDFHIVPQRAT